MYNYVIVEKFYSWSIWGIERMQWAVYLVWLLLRCRLGGRPGVDPEAVEQEAVLHFQQVGICSNIKGYSEHLPAHLPSA